MTVKQKIAVYMGLIMLLIAVLSIWGYFAYRGKTDVSEFIAQLAGLVTIIMSAIAALGGFHSAQSGMATPRTTLAALADGTAAGVLAVGTPSTNTTTDDASPTSMSPSTLTQ